MANNPGPFTFKGHHQLHHRPRRDVAILVDPGPDDLAHIGALLDAVRSETVTHIFVTHTHRDHSPAVPRSRPRPAATALCRRRPHRAARPLHIGEHNPLDATADRDFGPDVALKDGEIVAGDGWTVEAVATPATPPITWPMRSRKRTLCLPAIHVMAGRHGLIVAPPDGAMSDYMASLG